MRKLAFASIMVFAVIAVATSEPGLALSRRDFCAAVPYCSIPARFRSGPYLAKPVVREVSLAQVQKHCKGSIHTAGPFASTTKVLGCSKFQGASCVVYVPKEVRAISSEMFEIILQHELAHCRGWTHGR